MKIVELRPPPHDVARVVLTGFMGAGKSTVGRLLAPALGWSFFDVDSVIADRERLSVAEIFSRHGEAHFRSVEANLIRELLQAEAAVVALGGGALEHARTRSLLAETPHTLLVYLETSLTTSLERCASEAGAVARPILSDREALTTRYAARQPLYAMAHLSVSTEDLRPPEIVAQIAPYVRQASM